MTGVGAPGPVMPFSSPFISSSYSSAIVGNKNAIALQKDNYETRKKDNEKVCRLALGLRGMYLMREALMINERMEW
jgi:hypothetical protein